MMIRSYAASYECGRRLIASGCPIDYLKNLPRKLAAHRKRLYVQQLGGYEESCIYELGPLDAAYIIGIRIGTDIPSGIIIADWTFDLPGEIPINWWDYEPCDVVPKRDHHIYSHLFRSRLSAVLNERRLLARGRPVEGLVCGRAFEPIPESVASGETVHGKLSLTSDTGYTVALPITLRVDRSIARAPYALTERRKGRLFDKPDDASPEPLYLYK